MKKYWWLLVVLIACAGIGLGSYSLGKRAAEQSGLAEKEFNTMLNRAELEILKLEDGPIYVFGHKSPDSDTVCSAVVYAELLRQLGYEAKAAVLGKINPETAFILRTAGVEEPELLEDATGKNVVLIDHSDYLQSADGLKDANVISIIDHHAAGSVTTGNQLIYDARPMGCSATIVWLRARNYGLEIDKSMATLLLGGLLSDTKDLHNVNTAADRTAYEKLTEIAGVKDPKAFYQDIFKASISYEGMTDQEILENDIKNYESGGQTFAIGCIEAYDEAAAADLAGRMKGLMADLTVSRGADMSFAQVSVFHDDLSLNYIVPSDEKALEVLQAAFPDKGTFDGTSFILKPGVSRRQVLVPAISDVLAAHPGE